jgi:hypothetical protein
MIYAKDEFGKIFSSVYRIAFFLTMIGIMLFLFLFPACAFIYVTNIGYNEVEVLKENGIMAWSLTKIWCIIFDVVFWVIIAKLLK